MSLAAGLKLSALTKETGLSVFAVIEEATTARKCLAAAALAAAVTPGATITALHIEVDPERIVTAPEEISLQKMREPGEGTARDRAIKARRMFDFWAADNTVTNATWLEKVGTVESVLMREAQGADLVVISRPHNIDSSDALHAALFHTGLVLYVPDMPGRVASLHRHMAIAWKPRAQALRAVQRSLRWLQAADSVSIITVEEQDTQSDMLDLTQLLATHGVAPVVRSVVPLPKERVADCIIREAEVIGADSLVMGAFRFGMVMEWVFGGVTREILERSKLPIFLMH